MSNVEARNKITTPPPITIVNNLDKGSPKLTKHNGKDF
jgi:hypothetical protein